MMHLTAAMAIPAAAMRSATFEGPGAKTIPMPVQRTRRPGSRAFPLLSESTKGKGKSAHLCFMGNALMENRHGLAVAARLNCAAGTAEREAALTLVDRVQPASGATPGADKAHDA